MPATATYNPLTSQNLAYVIRADTRDTRRFADAPRPSPPLKGLRETRAATVSYRASVPSGHAGCEVASYQASSLYGETLSFEIKGSPSALPQSIPNSEFLIPNWTYTFSAKERDSETGLSYFGSRYYSSDLSIWLSVDPMSDKYASLSPYVYCANNPVRCVDPNGEEIGEYRDWNGNLLGTDGINDWNIFFVSDEESIHTIKNNEAAHGFTNRSDVEVDWETNKIVTQTIVSVYDWTVNNGGSREEAASFPGQYRLPKFYPTGDDNGEIEIDTKGYLSIHSHKLNYFDCPDGTGTCVQTPYDLSDKDKSVFPNYVYNVVVGNSYNSVQNFNTGTVYEKRSGMAVLYDSKSNIIKAIPIDDLRKIKFF